MGRGPKQGGIDVIKGKLDKLPIWLVTIIVPKQLMKNIYSGYKMNQDYSKDPATSEKVTPEIDPIENTAQGEV